MHYNLAASVFLMFPTSSSRFCRRGNIAVGVDSYARGILGKYPRSVSDMGGGLVVGYTYLQLAC